MWIIQLIMWYRFTCPIAALLQHNIYSGIIVNHFVTALYIMLMYNIHLIICTRFCCVLCCWICYRLTHWGRVTHIYVRKLTIIGSDNGLSPGWRQTVIRSNSGILLIGHLGTNFSEILIEIHTFSFKKMHLCPGSNALIVDSYDVLLIYVRASSRALWQLLIQ